MDKVKSQFKRFLKTGNINDYLVYANMKKSFKNIDKNNQKNNLNKEQNNY